MIFKPNLSLITLGVHDLARAKRFYEALGWKASDQPSGGVAFFELNGVILSLFPRADLAKDAKVPDTEPGFSGISLAYNVASDAEADEALAHAVACGATLVKPAEKVFWGGYSGYFRDPEGHLWEVAHNPFGKFDANGQFRM
ncbi:MAG: VOC family protein [Rhizobiaceae bacterium]